MIEYARLLAKEADMPRTGCSADRATASGQFMKGKVEIDIPCCVIADILTKVPVSSPVPFI